MSPTPIHIIGQPGGELSADSAQSCSTALHSGAMPGSPPFGGIRNVVCVLPLSTCHDLLYQLPISYGMRYFLLDDIMAITLGFSLIR